LSRSLRYGVSISIDERDLMQSSNPSDAARGFSQFKSALTPAIRFEGNRREDAPFERQRACASRRERDMADRPENIDPGLDKAGRGNQQTNGTGARATHRRATIAAADSPGRQFGVPATSWAI
jgi:hypothetical protein